VGDNVASVAVLMVLAKYYAENGIMPRDGIMFVFNSCEEGLGNLKGVRQLFEDYDKRVGQFISFDSKLNVVHDRCVGSHRYLVEAETIGGHSYYDFGTPNAIAALSSVVNDIYRISVPEKEGTKTTYNVGTISGGTSVNTIAQSASMLCEYRSDDKDSLAYMQRQFDDIFSADRGVGIGIKVTRVGSRPCSDIEEDRVEALKAVVAPVIESVIGEKVKYTSASTDCNIPMSLGVPSLCIGVSMYEGMHTREEKMLKKSVVDGLQIAIAVSIAITG
jgi:acetylornithine deacetylase/succinyl-diaminopimelate desuccinylase-like protein